MSVKPFSKEQVLERIKVLVENFKSNENEYTKSGSAYNETEARRDFIDPFFEVLGWDVSNKNGLSQHIREVIHEASVDVEDQNKKPDYAFRVGGIRKYFVEAKKPSVKIESDPKSSFQLKRYGWSAKMPVSVLTNFNYLIIYECKTVPKESDDYRIGRLKQYHYTEFVSKFDEIYDALSRESVYSGKFDEMYKLAEARGVIQVDSFFLSQIEKWREMLAKEIFSHNPKILQSELNYVIQTFLNRLVFLRICEDRNLEKYETLLKVKSDNVYNELLNLFKAADQKYNSGLFNFTKDVLSTKISLGNSVLMNIIAELYYPKSPYVFSVIETNLLGDIYEMFLSKEIIIKNKKSIEVREKPEVANERGVVTTPKFIVDSIISKSLQRLVEKKTPQDISKMHYADICCGSGAFLIAAFQYLIDYHIDWYVTDGPVKHKDKTYEGAGNTWFLTLEEKRRILINNIFGVDIDENAVEVAKFSLLIKILEGETNESINSLHSKSRVKALPDLDSNIQHGNSLVDKKMFKFKKISQMNSVELNSLKIFNWEEKFSKIFDDGGFDAIIGNPPYTRIQTMKKISPLELKYFQSKHSEYDTAQDNNFDKYFIFIERATHLLRNNGILGYITPHKFTKIKSGESLRKLISKNAYLNEIIHFGKEQVFGRKTTTYTAILVLSKKSNSNFNIELVTDINSWKLGTQGFIDIMKVSEISQDPWIFITGPLKKLHQRLETIKTTLQTVSEIYVGLQTSMDDVYIIKPEKISGNTVSFKDVEGRHCTIERGILNPCIYDLTLTPYSKPFPNAQIIFPYHNVGGNLVAYSLAEMKSKFPKTLAYLNQFKVELSKRDVQPKGGNEWYRYGRSQNLTKFKGREKLIVKVLSLEPVFTHDDSDLMFTGGGNGPHYGVSLKDDIKFSIHYLQALLNSPITDLFVKPSSSIFRGGYFSYGKQFIQDLPIILPDLSDDKQKKTHDEIVKLVKNLISLTTKYDRITVPSKRKNLETQIEAFKEELDLHVYQLYQISEEERKHLITLETGE